MSSFRFDGAAARMIGAQVARAGLALGLLAIAFAAFAAAPEGDADAPDWLQLFLGLFGGVALFLGGLKLLSEGMTKAAGDTLKTVLGTLTTNRFSGALTGAFITGVLNSSTVTTLLVVGFISGGMMTLGQSVGVIMGANIGSTVTAQLLAFNLSAYALGPVAIGFFMSSSAKSDKTRYYGMMLLGIGLVFYGMGVMGDAMTPLRSYEPFLAILEGLESPLAGILAGAVFTAIVQSSAATVGIAIAMASEGLLGLPAGIALALGANIGTAVTTAAMGFLSAKSTDALRASAVHVMFNVAGTLIWLPVIGLLVELAVWISPSSPALEGSARAAAEVPRQIANANTLFNVINTLVFIGFTGLFARIAEGLIPERETPANLIIEPEFLNDAALASPPIAMQQVRLELGRVGDIAVAMLRDVRDALNNDDVERLEQIARRDDEVDILEAAILAYLGKLRRSLLSEQDSAEFHQLVTAADNLESLADVIETDVAGLARKAIGLSQRGSDETRQMLIALYESTLEAVELTVTAIRDQDQKAAETVVKMKERQRRLADDLLSRKAQRLATDDPDYIALARMQMSFVDQMRRIYTLAKRISKGALPSVLAQKE